MSKYTECTESEIPGSLRWDTPDRNQGQSVEVSYALPGHRAFLADDGAPYKRVTDRSMFPGEPGRVRFFRR